jgi:hypothetical protein
VGGGRVNGDSEGGGIRSMYFIYLYKNGTMKLVEIRIRHCAVVISLSPL